MDEENKYKLNLSVSKNAVVLGIALGALVVSILNTGFLREEMKSSNITSGVQSVVQGMAMAEKLVQDTQSAALLKSTSTIQGGYYNAYSPTVLTVGGVKKMWFAGWLKKSDPDDFLNAVNSGADPMKIKGPDAIYLTEYRNGKWTSPQRVFDKIGYHVNDPSIIQVPGSNTLYMYYTSLANTYSDESKSVLFNQVGLAKSTDGGKTWKDEGIVIGQGNGIDNFGAWSPGAVLKADKKEIWVYYHLNGAFGVYRTVFKLDGKTPVGSFLSNKSTTKTKLLVLSKTCTSDTLLCLHCSMPGYSFTGCTYVDSWLEQYIPRINVDVAWDGTWYVMVANGGASNDCPSTGLSNISRYISTDGINWITHPQDKNPIICGGVASLPTPHIETLGWNKYNVYFGYSPEGKHDGSTSIHNWGFTSY